MGAQSKREKNQKTTRQAPRSPGSRRRLLLAPLPRSSLTPSGRPVASLAQSARKLLRVQTAVARCPGDGRLDGLPEKRKMMAGPGGQPPFARPTKNPFLFNGFEKRSQPADPSRVAPGRSPLFRKIGKTENSSPFPNLKKYHYSQAVTCRPTVRRTIRANTGAPIAPPRPLACPCKKLILNNKNKINACSLPQLRFSGKIVAH